MSQTGLLIEHLLNAADAEVSAEERQGFSSASFAKPLRSSAVRNLV